VAFGKKDQDSKKETTGKGKSDLPTLTPAKKPAERKRERGGRE
jgi:hypothetical protein